MGKDNAEVRVSRNSSLAWSFVTLIERDLGLPGNLELSLLEYVGRVDSTPQTPVEAELDQGHQPLLVLREQLNQRTRVNRACGRRDTTFVLSCRHGEPRFVGSAPHLPVSEFFLIRDEAKPFRLKTTGFSK
jgi:hypothetical protein